MRKPLPVIAFLSLATAASFPGGCGTTTGNPQVKIQFASYTAASWFELVPSAQAAVSSLTMCFKRLRFKTDSNDTSTTSGNVDITPGEITISSTGTDLVTVSVPSETYRRVEFDLNSDCASGKSVQLTNGSGAFSTSDGMTIKFEGTFEAEDSEETLVLGLQAIVGQLDTVTASSQIRDKAEAASGGF